MRIFLFILLSTFFVISFVSAQSRMNSDEEASSEEPLISATSINAFRKIALGMSLDQIKNIIIDDPFLNYSGEEDVYILPAKQQTLIECSGNSYIKRAYFQFYDNKLYIMIIELKEDKIDFYTLFSTLYKKYGKYNSFSPKDAIWELNSIRLALERPVILKYIDLKVFNSLKDEGLLKENSLNLSLKQFLDQF